MLLAYAILALQLGSPATAKAYFEVGATFTPPTKTGAEGSVDIFFTPMDPDVSINEEPAVRLKLDPVQVVLVERPKVVPPGPREPDPATPRYLDLAKPVSFPVALAPAAPRGTWDLGASVVYFFCSKREGWCRRGTADVRVPVTVP
jgi:hypothetical protein